MISLHVPQKDLMMTNDCRLSNLIRKLYRLNKNIRDLKLKNIKLFIKKKVT